MSPPHLLPGERILWSGRPPRGLRVRPDHAPPAGVALAALLMLAPWPGNASAAGGWMVPTVAAAALALALLVGPLLVDAWIRWRQAYFVTDRRALIVRPGSRIGNRTVALTSVPVMDVTERPDGSGDLRLGLPAQRIGRSGVRHERGRLVPALSPTPCFLGIPEVAAVCALIERVAAADGWYGPRP